MATIAVLSVVALAGSRLVFAATDALAGAGARAELVAAGSAAMERIAQDVRDIPLRPFTTPAEPYLDSITPGTIAWESDHTLALSNGSLTLAIAGTAWTLADNATGFSVRAYDQDNTALGASLSGDGCNAVRRLEITLTLSKGGVTETLRTRVFLRCMMVGAAP